MIRTIRAVAIVVSLAANVECGGARPLHRAPNAQEALEEASQLNRQVEKLYAEGKFQEAIALAKRVLEVRETVLGRSHPDVAESLNNFALLYQAQGEYAEAEPLYLRALDILGTALGRGHRNIAEPLNNLARLYRAQAAYDKAEPLYARALEILEKKHGPRHPDVAKSLNNLAVLYQAQGAYDKAEPLYTRALGIFETALGATHLEVAKSLNNLAGLFRDEGAYDKAELFYVRSLDIREKVLGPTHPDVAIALNNLASLYQIQGAYGKAEPFYIRSLEIREQAFGAMHPDVAASLNGLAEIYRKQGAYGKAEPLYVRSLEVREKSLGVSHPEVAQSLNSLAALYLDQGACERAELLYTRALAIREQTLGPTHPDVASSLNNLAWVYWCQGVYGKVEPLMSRAADIRERQLRTEIVRLPEPRKRALMALLQRETDGAVSLHVDAMPGSPPALELALTTVLRRKGRVLDSLVDSDTSLRSHLTPHVRDQFDQLFRARSELVAHLYAPAPGGAADRSTVAAIHVRIDELESALSAASAEFHREVGPVTLAKIQAALPEGAALVEFVRYQRLVPRQPPQRQDDRYLAYVMVAGATPRWVALGEAAQIDAQIDAMHAALHGRASGAATRSVLRHLDALVLAPIRARLSGASHLILAPDGKLNLVPFEALIDPQGNYALESYLVSYLTTGRELLRLGTPQSPRSPAVVVAAPDYGPLPPSGQPGMSFAPLPGALAEAGELLAHFVAVRWTGEMATKSALVTLAGPAMVHIATHGFYAREIGGPPARRVLAPLAPPDGMRGMFIDQGARQRLPSDTDELADALDRSGLAMAGANGGAAGIVTAREIAGFDWWGTQLVVLSACETGVGAVSSGDGVYGMRRALVLAGAASQVVSLWGADDTATRVLMRNFYDHLARGTGRAEALRQAKLHLLHQVRYAHPYYWAAFIPAGDWRPLDKSVVSLRKPRP